MNIIDKNRVEKVKGLFDPYPGSNVENKTKEKLRSGDALLRKSDNAWYILEVILITNSEEIKENLLFKFFGFVVSEQNLYNHFTNEVYNDEIYYKIKSNKEG